MDRRYGPMLASIEAMHDRQIDFLADLVRVPSDNPPGDCAPHAAVAADLLEALGFAVERYPVPAERVRANGMVSATNLIVRHRFGDGAVIALNAHGDVVAPGDGWTHEPYGAGISDGRMFGRGVAVSKSDFATYGFALKALIESGLPLKGTVELHLTYDEEAGGLIGPAWLLEAGLSRPDYAISAGFTYNVVVAHNGCLHLEVRVEGRSAHAARPDTGIDALEAATSLMTALYALRQEYRRVSSSVAGIGGPTLVIGLIEGGINTNVVPDRVTFRLDRRIIPEEDPDGVERELIGFIESAASSLPGIKVHIERVLLARPLAPLPGVDRVTRSLQRHALLITGENIPADGVPIYTDARLYAAAGIPTVLYGAGPHSLLEANGHRADENLVLSDLLKATKVVALTLADLLGDGTEPS